MGAAAFLGGLGEAAQKSNLQQAQLEHEGNEHMAQAMETLAQTAKPEYQPDYLQLAAKYRMLKPGQKPSKDMDPRAVMIRQLDTTKQAQALAAAHEAEVQRRVGQVIQQPPGPAQQGGGSQSNALPAPPPGMAGLPDQNDPQAQPAAPPQAQSAAGPAGLPPPPQAAAALPGVTPGVTQADGSAIPNTPSAGFSNGQLPPPPSSNGQVLTQYTPQERLAMQAQAEQMKYGAQNAAELDRAQKLAAFQRDQRKQVVADLKASGVKLAPRIEAQILSGQSIAPERAPVNIPGLVTGSSLPAGTMDAFGNAADPAKQYRIQHDVESGNTNYYPEIGSTKKSIQVSPDGKNANMITMDAAGKVVSSTPVAVPASYLPKTTSSSKTQYIDVGGEKVPVQVGSSSTRGVSMPSGASSVASPSGSGSPTARPSSKTLAPPPGSQGGGSQTGSLTKGLGPKQQMDAELKAGALDNTIDLVKNVQTNLPLLNNILTAKKIQFEADPATGFIHGVINRSLPMTPQEAQLAGNLQSLAEHINTLRGPLGATGFRGADAFRNLMAQGGSAMQNPQVVAQVLGSTMKALQTQRGVYTKHGVGTNLTPPPAGDSGSSTTEEEYIRDPKTGKLVKKGK